MRRADWKRPSSHVSSCMAELDIAERRRPQDGRIRVRVGDRELDVRVLDRADALRRERGTPLARSWRPTRRVGCVRHASGDPHKDGRASRDCLTAWCSSPGRPARARRPPCTRALRLRDADAEKVITIEDPIEYQLSGITQVPVTRTPASRSPRRCGRSFGKILTC